MAFFFKNLSYFIVSVTWRILSRLFHFYEVVDVSDYVTPFQDLPHLLIKLIKQKEEIRIAQLCCLVQ